MARTIKKKSASPSKKTRVPRPVARGKAKKAKSASKSKTAKAKLKSKAKSLRAKAKPARLKARPKAKPSKIKAKPKSKKSPIRSKAKPKPKTAPKTKTSSKQARPPKAAKGSAKSGIKKAPPPPVEPPKPKLNMPTIIKTRQPPPSKPRKRVTFDAKELAAIKEGLLSEQAELQAELEEIEQTAFQTSQSEISGEVSYDADDYADAGSATFEREKDLSIANNVQDLLEKINKALLKIDDGTYGLCESCGEPIDAARLKALPHALLCIRCKKAEERR